MQTTGFISSFVLALALASAGAEGAKEPFFEGLGSYTRKVSTESPEAQKIRSRRIAARSIAPTQRRCARSGKRTPMIPMSARFLPKR
jgi:hypothetical protein